jgi:hypothetical protein
VILARVAGGAVSQVALAPLRRTFCAAAVRRRLIQSGGDGKDLILPDGDIAATNWQDLGGNSIHFDELDETTTADDTTYTQTSAASGGTGDDLTVRLADLPDPLNNVNHLVDYRWRNAGDSTGVRPWPSAPSAAGQWVTPNRSRRPR